ncbi:MAG: ATP-binding protein [Thermodesulfobacteriota bacterium]|nr:ATP-binding protein [Thermodesulfobacteriota bacterium]
MRFFNTAGPVNCEEHYCINPLCRFDLEEMLLLIDQKKYFVLHAPRQTGKTTCMLALMKYLNNRNDYTCLYCNVESAQAAREDVEQGINDILRELATSARIHLNDSFIEESLPRLLQKRAYGTALNHCLALWAEHNSKPLVLILDEIDSLIGDTLISVLRQLRSGYTNRPAFFPQTVILCGVRDIRDYRIHSGREKEIITGGSCFNIKAKSLRLGDFIKEEVFSLLAQHQEETGQDMEKAAREKIWEFTNGQPWLVNALAYEACFEIKEGRDRDCTITCEMIEQAKENLIIRRETHLHQLADKLREERVKRVIGPMLSAGTDRFSYTEDDIQYLIDIGLIKRSRTGELSISNPIYMEIVPRELTWAEQSDIHEQTAWYVNSAGFLDMGLLLEKFQEFFREHSEHWLERFQYKEAGPQLLLQAFLQRIVNSGGRVEREYGLGRMRTDLLVIWPVFQETENAEEKTENGRGGKGEIQKVVIELKILYKSLEKTITDGLKQTAAYMDRCNAGEGHLVIFDRRENVHWEEKIFKREEGFEGKSITVWGM